MTKEERNARNTELKKANPEKYRLIQRRYGWKKRGIRITEAEYVALLARQGGVCGVCQRPPTSRKRLAVDHIHESGEIRGLLCTNCNVKLGWFDRHCAAVLAYRGSEPYEVHSIYSSLL